MAVHQTNSLEFSQCKYFYPLLSWQNYDHCKRQKSSKGCRFQDTLWHPGGYEKARTMWRMHLHPVIAINLQLPSNSKLKRNIISAVQLSTWTLDINMYFPCLQTHTFNTFPSKSRMAVPICFATFSNSSMSFLQLRYYSKIKYQDLTVKEDIHSTCHC